MSEHSSAASVFTNAELEHFRTEDYSAGKAVVLLMIGIFSTGVFLYLLVALAIWLRVGFLA